MRKRRVELVWVVLTIWLSAHAAWAAEPGCYRTAAEAAAQAGPRGVEGFRLASLRRDPFSGVTWASMIECGHAERPATLMVVASGAEVRHAAFEPARPILPLLMIAGTRVRVVELSDHASLEYSAIAQGSGRAGDRVRVRLLPFHSVENDSAPERFAEGIIRSSALVEVEAP